MSVDITFEESAVDHVLREFDKSVDDEGYIIEEESGDRVLTPEGDELRVDDLGAIAKGSEIFIEDNFVSVLEYVETRSQPSE